VSWSANGDPAGTVYEVQASTDGFTTLNVSSLTVGFSAVLDGLAANTTLYFRLRALNHAWVGSSFTAAGSTITRVAEPAPAPAVSLGSSTVSAQWDSGGNDARTDYSLQVSTDDFGSVNATSITRNTSVLFAGLTPNTSYYFRVRAAGLDGTPTAFVALGSTMTYAALPGALPFTSVDASSVAAAWTNGGNPDGTRYVSEVSTDGFATMNASSETAALSVLHGTGGAGAALSPNTTYYFQVRALGPAAPSGEAALGSTVTLAVPPVSAVSTFTTVFASSISVAWGGAGNPVDVTTYTVVLSSGGGYPNSFSGNVVLATAPAGPAPAATLTGLIANTTWYLYVRAVNHGGTGTLFIALGSTYTPLGVPGSAAETFPAVGASSMTVAWGRSGNAVDVTTYTVVLTTGSSYPNTFTGNVSASTTPPGPDPEAVLTGLELNTTYYLFVEALDAWGGGSGFAALSSTPTYALSPGGAVLSGVQVTSAALSWSANGDPAGTVFEAQASTDAFVTLSASSRTVGLDVVFDGLASNTTLYFRLRALNHAWVGSSFTAAGSTITHAAEPVPAPTLSNGPSSVTSDWGPNGNVPGTDYLAQISTDSFGTVNASSSTRETSADFTGLEPNTTYYLRVRAVGHDGTPTAFVALPSTMTQAVAPGAAAVPFPTVDVASITVMWTSGGNPGGTLYVNEVSTDGFATVNWSSVTVALSVLHGTGGAGLDLLANATYYFRVRSIGPAGPGSPVALGSTITLAEVPQPTLVVSVSSTSVALGWVPVNNPVPGTQYVVERDTEAAFTQAVSSETFASAYLASGLAGDTTYYFRVRAKNGNGIPTSPAVTVSTRTLPLGPAVPGLPAAVDLGLSSIAWSWAASTGALRYQVFRASDASTLAASTPTAAYLETGLATNTAYGILARARNDFEFSALSPAATVFTRAEPPSGSAWTSVEATSATIAWSSGTNPSWTVAELERSTDGASYALRSSGTFAGFLDQELAGCTTYFFRARYLNGDGVPTAYDTPVEFTTHGSTPLPAGAFAATSLPGWRIRLDWQSSGSGDVSSYRIYYDSGTEVVDFGTPLAVLASSETSYTTDILVASAAYKFVLRALNRCGVEDGLFVAASAEAAESFAGVRAAVTVPASGASVRGSGITVKAQLQQGTIFQTQSVLFQYKPSGGTSWTDIVPVDSLNHPNPAVGFPFYLHWNISALPATGQYDLRAKAVDVSAQEDANAPAVTITLVGSSEVSEVIEDVVGGSVLKRQLAYQNAQNTVETAASGSSKLSRVVIPSGALDLSSRTVTLNPDPAAPSPPPFGTRSLGILVEASIEGQTVLAGGNKAAVTLSYPDANGDGIVDGMGVRARDVVMYSHSGAGWVNDLSVSVDIDARTITGLTPHFSFFGLFAPTQSDLSRLRVYPVPFKPNSGSADDGVPYSPGDLNSGIIFDQLPDDVSIRIYTVTGQKVAEASSASARRIQWDARNGAGRDAASGGYIAVISSPGQKDVVRKLLIIR